MKRNIFKEPLKDRFLKLLNKEGFYVAIFLCITVVATMIVYFTNNSFEGEKAQNIDEQVVATDEKNQADIEEVINDIEDGISKREEEDADDDSTEKESEDVKEEDVTEKATEPPATPSKSTDDILNEIVNPVGSNDVVMAFSLGGQPVYSKTLQAFASDHCGIDIKADIGTEVKAALDGKVVEIKKDGKLGQTIVIQHDGNLETRYSNLSEDVSVTINQNVKAGQVIGKVGETATFESAEEPHLHFEILKNGKHVDPEEYLN